MHANPVLAIRLSIHADVLLLPNSLLVSIIMGVTGTQQEGSTEECDAEPQRTWRWSCGDAAARQTQTMLD